MLKVGHTVKHLYDNPEAQLGEGRVVMVRRGSQLALVKWSTGQCSEHMIGALKRLVRQ